MPNERYQKALKDILDFSHEGLDSKQILQPDGSPLDLGEDSNKPYGTNSNQGIQAYDDAIAKATPDRIEYHTDPLHIDQGKPLDPLGGADLKNTDEYSQDPQEQIKSKILQRLVEQSNKPGYDSGSDIPDPDPSDPSGRFNDYRQAMNHSNYFNNFGEAVAQAAQGPQTPQINHQLYNHMNSQDSDMFKSFENESDRRQKVSNAIQERKLRDSIVDKTLANSRGISDSNNASHERIAALGVKGRADVAATKAAKPLGSPDKLDALARQRASKFENNLDQNDKLIAPYTQNIGSLEKAQGILRDKTTPLIPQKLTDIMRDYVQATSLRGGNSTTDSQHHAMQISTARGLMSKFKQFFNPKADLRADDPDTVGLVSDMVDSLRNDYLKDLNNRRNEMYEKEKLINAGDPRYIEHINNLQKFHQGNFNQGQPAPSPTASGEGLTTQPNPAATQAAPHTKAVIERPPGSFVREHGILYQVQPDGHSILPYNKQKGIP